MGFLSSYFNWLQKDCPTGEVERYPQLDDKGQSSLNGCYIVGDLTGIPLLKLAADSGSKMVRQFCYDDDFSKRQGKEDDIFDILIIGAGPAGISAAIECEKRNLKYKVLESSAAFNTIKNFPKGKPILCHPDDFETTSELELKDGTKESLLEDLKASLKEHDLQIQSDTHVEKISRSNNLLEVKTKDKSLKCLRVILAIGKSGNSKKLNIPGEELDKVSNRLFDPGEFEGKKILVVGGGDSALETAVALAKTGNEVTLSYRGDQFSRPKQENMEEVQKWQREGKIHSVFESKVKGIHAKSVVLKTREDEREIDNDQVFVMIGKELPLQFFRRSGILMEGEKSLSWYSFLITMISFFTMLYFGKSGVAVELVKNAEGGLAKLSAFLTSPFHAGLSLSSWYSSLNFLLGWTGAIAFFFSGVFSLGLMFKEREKYFKTGWPLLKYSYLILAAFYFTFTYIYYHFMADSKQGWVEGTTYSYSLLYCTTMALFGARRAYVKRTRYIKYQMLTLVSIQVFFLFLLPFHFYQPLENLFGAESSFIKQVFPSGKWSSFSLILFWPLTMWEFGKSTFWTYFPLVQTFVFLPLLIKYWGKGVYCGWICSCGGMAETLGDEYRDKSPHGPKAKKLENIGQYVLVFAMVTTIVVFFGRNTSVGSGFEYVYKLLIDVFFAGVLGLGVYFFMGGRVWCRFGCPLAALMNIYTRFSRYRIFAEKKKCISCNICTKVCHMGIDVMSFANKGIPMNDAQCVRCSACVVECPMDVLAFGAVSKGDPDNKEKIEIPSYGKENWKAGLK
ncbi:MAG: NAD(P)-binding domain-containing protein [Lentisphaeraceae bacterium]|nr:NAD(P)-binding domain-containing protein [Lentisphaeraceae bacterium]